MTPSGGGEQARTEGKIPAEMLGRVQLYWALQLAGTYEERFDAEGIAVRLDRDPQHSPFRTLSLRRPLCPCPLCAA